MTRRAVVSYEVDTSVTDRRRALLDGIRTCAEELMDLGNGREAVGELEQVANDIEAGEAGLLDV